MRTKNLLLSAAALVAGVLSAQAQQNVYSVNVVGYVNLTVPAAGGFAMLNQPLSGATNLNEIFTNAPVNTKVWEFVGGSWVAYTKRNTGLFSGYDGHAFNPGVGYFVQTPATSTTPYTNTFVGTVVTGTNVLSYLTGSGFTAVGPVTPIAGGVQTVLGVPAVNGDKIWTYDPSLGWLAATRRTSSWSGQSYSGTPGSPVTGVEPVISVGQGFFIQGSGAGTSGSWTNVYNIQ